MQQSRQVKFFDLVALLKVLGSTVLESIRGSAI